MDDEEQAPLKGSCNDSSMEQRKAQPPGNLGKAAGTLLQRRDEKLAPGRDRNSCNWPAAGAVPLAKPTWQAPGPARKAEKQGERQWMQDLTPGGFSRCYCSNSWPSTFLGLCFHQEVALAVCTLGVITQWHQDPPPSPSPHVLSPPPQAGSGAQVQPPPGPPAVARQPRQLGLGIGAPAQGCPAVSRSSLHSGC